MNFCGVGCCLCSYLYVLCVCLWCIMAVSLCICTFSVFDNNNRNNDFISIALFHVKHAQLR